MECADHIKKHFTSLWFTALRLTRNKEDAEDLIQETCLKAFRNIESLRSEGKSKAWLIKILTNTFINKYRKDQTAPDEIDVEPDFLEPISYKNGQFYDLEKELFSKVMDNEVKAAIDKLPVEFRMAIVFVDIEELSYREVEDILKISPGTLASRLYRGRRLLRDTLYDYARHRGYLKEKTNEV